METFDDEVMVLRRSGLVLAASAVPLALGALLACGGQPSAVGLGIATAWLGLGGLLYTWSRNPAALEVPARAHVDERGLYVDGKLAMRSAYVLAGWLQPRVHEPPVVHVRGRWGRGASFVVRDAERGRAMLRALDVDPTRASAHYWALARPLGEPKSFARAATLIGAVLAVGLVAGDSAPVALALAVVALIVLFVGAALPTHVVVGADGVLLRWLGTSRFVPWSRVLAVEDYDAGVVLALEGGEWVTLRTPPEHERHHPERAAMVERMRVAWRAHAHARVDEPAARLVRRAGGRTREWVRAMRSLAGGRDGYRTASVPPERLWRVVEDPRADRASRTGAALALAPLLDDAGRDRLRTLAFACAEPRLRVALKTAATELGATAPDDEVAATLDAIESEGDAEAALER